MNQRYVLMRRPVFPSRQIAYQRMTPSGMRTSTGSGSGGCLRIVFGLAIAAFAVISFFGSKQYNPVTGEDQYVTITKEQEIALGLQSAPEMAAEFGGLDQDIRVQNFVDEIGQKLVNESFASQAEYPFEFTVLADDQTVNAFALPGGQVFITRGLLNLVDTEGELAAVLGHEIVHVVARHSAEQIAQQQLTQGLTGALVMATYDPENPASMGTAQVAMLISQLISMKFSREDEIQSDQMGVRVISEAGFDPRAMISVMRKMEQSSGGMNQLEFFSTHPSYENRLQSIQNAINTIFPNGVPGSLIP